MMKTVSIPVNLAVVLLACVCCVARTTNDNVTDLYLIGLFPMSGVWNKGLGMSVAAEMAVEDINNRSDILNGYRLNIIINNTDCDAGQGIKILADSVCQPPTKIMIIGDGCSPVSTAVAQVAHRWNLLQVSYGASSPALSNREKFPYFYRIVNSETVMNKARIEVLKFFNWTRVATLRQTNQIFATMMEDLVINMNKENFEISKECVFSENPENEVRRLKEADARIIVAGLYRDKARQVFCAAYNVGFYGKQVWIVVGTITHDNVWWKEPDPSINCTGEQILEAAQGALIIDDMYYNEDDNDGTLTGMTVKAFQKIFKEKTKNILEENDMFWAPSGYDTVWAAAIALNKTMNHLQTSGSKKLLGEFTYDNKGMADVIKQELLEVNFSSVSGRVSFNENNEGVRLIIIERIEGSNLSQVGEYDVKKPKGKRLVIGDIWNGQVPADRKFEEWRVMSIEVYIYVPVMSLAGIGIVMSVTFLAFNIINRNVKIIRMSSPHINNIILVGCILAYLSVYIEDINNTKKSIYCMSKSFILLLAFSLSFGALFAKTWRTYSIFRATLQMRKLKTHSIQDSRLCLMVLGLVTLNSLVFGIWIKVDPQTVITRDIEILREETEDIVVNYSTNSCYSKHQSYFLICILIIQGIFLLLGVFLAWETRKVQLSILNESRYIGMCIYNVVALGVVGVLVSYSINNNPSLVYALTSCIVCLCATVTQSLLFVPKVVACRKFKQGKLQDAIVNKISSQFCAEVGSVSIGSQTDLLAQISEIDAEG